MENTRPSCISAVVGAINQGVSSAMHQADATIKNSNLKIGLFILKSNALQHIIITYRSPVGNI
jgi:hypothetical protein